MVQNVVKALATVCEHKTIMDMISKMLNGPEKIVTREPLKNLI